MTDILKGEGTSENFTEAREEDKSLLRIQNSAIRAEHLCKIKLKTPNILNITIESEGRAIVYSIDILPRDLLIPIYKNISLFGLKLLLGKAIKGDFELKLNFITMDELRVNSIFLWEPMIAPRSVREEDSAAVLLEISYELDEKECNIALQIPRILHEGGGEVSAPEELVNGREPSDLYQQNRNLQEMLGNLQQENRQNQKSLHQSQQEILNLKSDK